LGITDTRDITLMRHIVTHLRQPMDSLFHIHYACATPTLICTYLF
jgi:hypothetical protein